MTALPWRMARLKYLYASVDRRAIGSSLPLLSVSIHRGVTRRDEVTQDDHRADTLDGYKICRSGDLVLNRMRAFQGAVGISPVDGLVSPDYLVLRPTPETDGRYLHHLLRSDWLVGQMIARLRGIGSTDLGTVRTPRINADDLGDIEIALPPLGEQRRIADFLDAETRRIDRLLALRDHHLALVQEQRMARVVGMVTGAGFQERRPSGLIWHPDLPANWSSAKLTLVARLGSGHTPSRSRPEWWNDCYIPWITTGEVQQVRDDRREVLTETREYISDLGLANSAAELHPSGTVVLCRTASAGYSAVMGRDMATSQDFATWTCGRLLDPYFLLWCLRAMRPDLLGRLAMGSTHKTIYMPDVQSIRIPLPSVVQQREIVAEIRQSNAQLDALTDAVEAQRTLLRERRAAVITAAVTGELDVSTARGAA